MGKIVGWGSVDSSADAKSLYLANEPAINNPLHVSSETDAITYEIEDVAYPVIEPDNPSFAEYNSLSSAHSNKSGISEEAPTKSDPEKAYEQLIRNRDAQFDSEADTENDVFSEADSALEVDSAEIQVAKKEPNQGESKTQRICLAISKLKLSCSERQFGIGSYCTYCDITETSGKAIRALINLADPEELDFFGILEALQEIVSEQGEVAAERGEDVKSPNLNDLIDFIDSIAAK